MFYNHIAGQSLDRLAALSDGIFAVAMTLLVLDLRVPVSSAINVQPLWVNGSLQSEYVLWSALVHLLPNFITYAMGFLTLGIFWIGQQTQLSHFARSDRNLTWMHIVFLLAISLMPFSTGLLAANITYRLALVIYWLNILLPGILLFGSMRYAWRMGLMKDDRASEVRSLNERRIAISQVLYACGALLCVINTYWSIAFIALVQLFNLFIRW